MTTEQYLIYIYNNKNGYEAVSFNTVEEAFIFYNVLPDKYRGRLGINLYRLWDDHNFWCAIND